MFKINLISRWAKLIYTELSYYFVPIVCRPPLSEIVAQPGADHEEIAVGIRDVLAAGLHVQRAGELAPPRHFNGVLAGPVGKGHTARRGHTHCGCLDKRSPLHHSGGKRLSDRCFQNTAP